MKIKQALVVSLVGAVLSAASFSHAASAEVSMITDSFWGEVSALVFRSAEQPYGHGNAGVELYGKVRSVSPNLQVDDMAATFTLHGETYFATITDSADSDGGDLNDLVIKDQNGHTVAEQFNILAFRDIVLALALGEEGFRKVYDPGLNL